MLISLGKKKRINPYLGTSCYVRKSNVYITLDAFAVYELASTSDTFVMAPDFRVTRL